MTCGSVDFGLGVRGDRNGGGSRHRGRVPVSCMFNVTCMVWYVDVVVGHGFPHCRLCRTSGVVRACTRPVTLMAQLLSTTRVGTFSAPP